MVDKRPFVDRRIGFVVLFMDNVDSPDEERIKELVRQNLEVTNLSVYPTQVRAKDNPPQAKIIMSESSLSPNSISTIASTITNTLEDDMNMGIVTMEVSSFALSPGDKVRNTIGV